jgi:hypothetical protein
MNRDQLIAHLAERMGDVTTNAEAASMASMLEAHGYVGRDHNGGFTVDTQNVPERLWFELLADVCEMHGEEAAQ